MVRNAFRWIVVALVAASMLIVAAIVLNRLALSQQPAIAALQVPASNMAVLLDENGAGLQIIPDAKLSVRLSPYPAQVNAPVALVLVALDPETNTVKQITPTLEIAPLVEVEGASYAMKSDAAGSYSAGGVFFLSQANIACVSASTSAQTSRIPCSSPLRRSNRCWRIH